MHPKTQLRAIFVATWALLTFACFFVVLPSVGKDPSFSLALATEWPASTKLARGSTSGHLVVFVHPYCPCTRATLWNLDGAVDSTNLTVSIVQLRTESLAAVHYPISSIASTADKNGWNLILDNEGVETDNFGASTSGECMLFNSKGSLLFAGGVTASRGHTGNNQGLDTLKDLIERINSKSCDHNSSQDIVQSDGGTQWAQFPTFGCPLLTEPGCSSQLSTCQQHAN